LIQTYFRKFGIAFTEQELAKDDTEEFAPTVSRTASEVRHLKFKSNNQNKKDIKNSSKASQKTTSLWDEFTQESSYLDNTQGVQQDDTIVDPTVKINTGISEHSIHAASVAYLGIDLVLSIVYLSILMSGCKWIQISDLFRIWIWNYLELFLRIK